MGQSIMDFIGPTEPLLTVVQAALAAAENAAGWDIRLCQSEKPDALFSLLPDLRPPAVVLRYSGSAYGDQPRRATTVAAIVFAELQRVDGGAAVRAMLDTVIAAVDGLVSGRAAFRIKSDKTLDLSERFPALTAIEIQFEINVF